MHLLEMDKSVEEHVDHGVTASRQDPIVKHCPVLMLCQSCDKRRPKSATTLVLAKNHISAQTYYALVPLPSKLLLLQNHLTTLLQLPLLD